MAVTRGACLLLLVSFAISADAVGVSSVFSISDQVRFKQKFYDAMPFKDLETAAYSVIALKLMKAEVPPTQDVCKFAKANVDSSNVKSIFYASVIAELLGSCKLEVDDAAKKMLSEVINEGTDMITLHHAVIAQNYFGMKVDTGEVIKAVKASINSDEDSILGAAYAMLIGETLPKGTDVSFITEMIEDTVAQADEIDNKYLQFEGGLHVTSLVVYAAYSFSDFVGKAPAITEEQVIKFTNYLLTRKHVQSVRETATLLLAVDKLGNNQVDHAINAKALEFIFAETREGRLTGCEEDSLPYKYRLHGIHAKTVWRYRYC